jgi:hypothetical protein
LKSAAVALFIVAVVAEFFFLFLEAIMGPERPIYTPHDEALAISNCISGSYILHQPTFTIFVGVPTLL